MSNIRGLVDEAREAILQAVGAHIEDNELLAEALHALQAIANEDEVNEANAAEQAVQ